MLSDSDPATMDPSEREWLIEIAAGFEGAKLYALASFIILIYDHLLCLNQESGYFWRSGWSFTKILYFLNRFIPLIMFSIQLSYFLTPDVPLDYCTAGIKTVLSLEVVGMIVVEAILVARVYYLWSHSLPTQIVMLIVSVACISVAVVYAGIAINALGGAYLPVWLGQPGCINEGHAVTWPVFLPLFLLETILFVATIVRVLRPLRSGKSKPVASRLFRDGVLFFLVAFISISFTVEKSIQTKNPEAYLPALLSNAFYATHSICASHLILSIHSLAADLGSDPRFLLSNVEIGRLAARRGANANELVVNCRDDDDEGDDDTLVELSELNQPVQGAHVIQVTRSSISFGRSFDQGSRRSLGLRSQRSEQW